MAKVSPLMIAPPVTFAALAVLFYVGMNRENPNELPTALAGEQAPAVVVSELGEKTIFTDETLRDGNIKLVNFWASWCGPCRVEHPNLEQLKVEGVPIYGVNYKDPARNALSFLDELGDPYVGVGADPKGRMGLDWGVYGVPETYLIDGDGKVILRIAGPLTQREMTERLRPAMAELE
ncbi:DsbE family thiol:disulfide interchange protein [Shimia abyssi]|uniref:Cytochrome c biogenesis protein CcmG/thiol:disulfide interchange protein DsbE n=1 Tax=Shimia abyssi TaxID=1662395 RepID=A0A2P8FIY2_9RHOB|nr:DsbE family thiol:disulfide interchange protein [Shimia abyssi]PSL21667.1 cytochrome c biogenesis protein CcmG/thiol:disulfide interchange protein DsbE [Shimia abyssi]